MLSNLARSRFRACFRFCCNDRVSWQSIVIPVGRCVRTTLLLVLFTFCPPFPEPLTNFSSISSSFKVIDCNGAEAEAAEAVKASKMSPFVCSTTENRNSLSLMLRSRSSLATSRAFSSSLSDSHKLIMILLCSSRSAIHLS